MVMYWIGVICAYIIMRIYIAYFNRKEGQKERSWKDAILNIIAAFFSWITAGLALLILIAVLIQDGKIKAPKKPKWL